MIACSSRITWKVVWAAALVVALAATLSAGDADRALGDDDAADPTTTFEERFASTGAQRMVYFDAGVRNVDVIAIGGFGASSGSRLGGVGAKVEARVSVGSNRRLYVLVGGNGNGEHPGFNGGGAGSKPSWTPARGGGGGGATDLRTISAPYLDSLNSRVVVAGGGGGASGASLREGRQGGIGGDAGGSGARGDNATPNNTIGSGGFGGAPGTGIAGGVGGDPGFVYFNGGVDGSGGGVGHLGEGGPGGAGASNSGTGMGAGGGGGHFGGGGGGGGMLYYDGQEYFSGGGGGGGGSSLLPEGDGTVSLASRTDEPSVEISYTVPGTSILTGPAEAISTNAAEFSFESSEPGSTFECRLGTDGDFSACESPVTLDDLTEGPQVFEVRAINQMDNFDDTPAVREFIVDTSAPVARIDSGPSGGTTERRPEFTFSASEAGVTFRCRFGQESFRSCTGSDSDRPAADLTIGTHVFAVKAVDRAGNVGPDATREFEVEAGSPVPPAVRARLQLKRPRLNRKRGIAVLPARVSGPGTVTLMKNSKVRASKRKVGRASTVKLRVAVKGRALKRLRRQGKLRLKVRVRFAPRIGLTVIESRSLTLRKS